MTRFKLQDWAGYVRGVLSPNAMEEMAELLSQGCPESTRLHQLALQVHDAKELLAGPGAPDSVLKKAFGIFPARESKSFFELPLLSMNLLFDSLLEPQPAGIRSQAALSRETVHEAEGIQLRLAVEQDRSTRLIAIVGQLMAENEAVSVSNRPVLIYQKEHLVARSLSGEQGEFQLEFSGREPLKLLLLLENPDRRIELEIVQSSGKKRNTAPGSRITKE